MLLLIAAVLSTILIVTGFAGSLLLPLLCGDPETKIRNPLRRFAEAPATPLLAGMIVGFSTLLVLGSFKNTDRRDA